MAAIKDIRATKWKSKHFKSLENPKRIEWEFLKVTTTLYNNKSILICQNSIYISKK